MSAVEEHDSIAFSLEPIWPSSVRPLTLAVPEVEEEDDDENEFLSTDSDSLDGKRGSLRRWLRCGRFSESRSSNSSDLHARLPFGSDTVLGRLGRRLLQGCFDVESSASALPVINGPRPSLEVNLEAPPPSLFTMNDAQNYIEVAFMYLDRGDMVAAERNVRTAIRIADKNNVSARSRADLLTVLAIATGGQDSSERNLSKALAIYKKDPPTGNFGEIALRSLLAVLCRQGRYEESVEVAARYRQFIPKNKPRQSLSLRRSS